MGTKWGLSERERFERFVDRSGGPDSCHLWTGFLDRKGYARFAGVLGVSAARNALAYDGRPPSPGEHARHTCDNRACVNPRHLLPGSAADNKRDAMERGRHARGETNGQSRLTWPQVRQMRARWAAGGVTTRDLAREYGVSRNVAWAVVAERNWRDDPERMPS